MIQWPYICSYHECQSLTEGHVEDFQRLLTMDCFKEHALVSEST